MLFSCLVDADRLDTERFMDVESWRKRGNSATLADLLPQLEAYMQKLQSNAADTKVNRIRQQVKEQCSRTSSSAKKDFIVLQFRREAVKHFLLCYGP